MKNILKELLILTIIIIYLIYSLTFNYYFQNQVIYSFNIWLLRIVPALFPTFIICDLLINSNIPYYINKYFHINIVYLISIISGSPTNSYVLSKYNTDITKHLSITKYSSLIFTFSYLSLIFNKQLAIILIIGNILANIILYFIIRPSKLPTPYHQNFNFISIILSSISKNMSTLINILGTIILFNTLPLNMITNPYLKSLSLSFLEITSSFNNLSLVNIAYHYKLLFGIITVSTCGLCIETQIRSITLNSKVNYSQYFIYRLVHLILHLVIIYIIILFVL